MKASIAAALILLATGIALGAFWADYNASQRVVTCVEAVTL